jgi:two-component system chemotaxis response regulator CheY
MAIRVLIVDDSVSIRDLLRLDLESIGCRVVAEAENASQALDLFRTIKPDVVTLDVLMPRVGNLDSLGFFRILRKEAPSVPVIIVSVVADPEIRGQFIDGGALEYVVKPFNPRTFQKIKLRLMERFPEMRQPEVIPPRRAAPSRTRA